MKRNGWKVQGAAYLALLMTVQSTQGFGVNFGEAFKHFNLGGRKLPARKAALPADESVYEDFLELLKGQKDFTIKVNGPERDGDVAPAKVTSHDVKVNAPKLTGLVQTLRRFDLKTLHDCIVDQKADGSSELSQLIRNFMTVSVDFLRDAEGKLKVDDRSVLAYTLWAHLNQIQEILKERAKKFDLAAQDAPLKTAIEQFAREFLPTSITGFKLEEAKKIVPLEKVFEVGASGVAAAKAVTKKEDFCKISAVAQPVKKDEKPVTPPAKPADKPEVKTGAVDQGGVTAGRQGNDPGNDPGAQDPNDPRGRVAGNINPPVVPGGNELPPVGAEDLKLQDVLNSGLNNLNELIGLLKASKDLNQPALDAAALQAKAANQAIAELAARAGNDIDSRRGGDRSNQESPVVQPPTQIPPLSVPASAPGQQFPQQDPNAQQQGLQSYDPAMWMGSANNSASQQPIVVTKEIGTQTTTSTDSATLLANAQIAAMQAQMKADQDRLKWQQEMWQNQMWQQALGGAGFGAGAGLSIGAAMGIGGAPTVPQIPGYVPSVPGLTPTTTSPYAISGGGTILPQALQR